MGHSEDYIRNKTYELEKQKIELEKEKMEFERAKIKILMDIRDVMLMHQAMVGLDVEKKAKAGEYEAEDIRRVGDDLAGIKERIEKRWSE